MISATQGQDRRPVLVVAYRIERARALQQRLDRPPLRPIPAVLDPDGTVRTADDDHGAVVLSVPAATVGAVAPWDVVSALHRERPRVPVIIATEDPLGPAMDLCLLAGARTVLDASTPDDELIAAIDHVCRGGSPGPAITDRRRRALQRLVRGDGTRPPEAVRLSRLEPVPRTSTPVLDDDRLRRQLGSAQQAVVDGVLAGATVPEVAAARGVSAAAMYAARRRLAERLDVNPEQVDGEVVRRWG